MRCGLNHATPDGHLFPSIRPSFSLALSAMSGRQRPPSDSGFRVENAQSRRARTSAGTLHFRVTSTHTRCETLVLPPRPYKYRPSSICGGAKTDDRKSFKNVSSPARKKQNIPGYTFWPFVLSQGEHRGVRAHLQVCGGGLLNGRDELHDPPCRGDYKPEQRRPRQLDYHAQYKPLSTEDEDGWDGQCLYAAPLSSRSQEYACVAGRRSYSNSAALEGYGNVQRRPLIGRSSDSGRWDELAYCVVPTPNF